MGTQISTLSKQIIKQIKVAIHKIQTNYEI